MKGMSAILRSEDCLFSWVCPRLPLKWLVSIRGTGAIQEDIGALPDDHERTLRTLSLSNAYLVLHALSVTLIAALTELSTCHRPPATMLLPALLHAVLAATMISASQSQHFNTLQARSGCEVGIDALTGLFNIKPKGPGCVLAASWDATVTNPGSAAETFSAGPCDG